MANLSTIALAAGVVGVLLGAAGTYFGVTGAGDGDRLDALESGAREGRDTGRLILDRLDRIEKRLGGESEVDITSLKQELENLRTQVDKLAKAQMTEFEVARIAADVVGDTRAVDRASRGRESGPVTSKAIYTTDFFCYGRDQRIICLLQLKSSAVGQNAVIPEVVGMADGHELRCVNIHGAPCRVTPVHINHRLHTALEIGTEPLAELPDRIDFVTLNLGGLKYEAHNVVVGDR